MRFTTTNEGTHRICYLSTSDGAWFSSTKTRLHVDLASDDKYNLIASSEDEAKGLFYFINYFFFILNTNPFFVDLTDRVAALNTRLESILGEQMLQRSREMTFRDTSESANSRVVRWTIVQIVVLLVTCIWQLSHLQRMYQFFLIYF